MKKEPNQSLQRNAPCRGRFSHEPSPLECGVFIRKKTGARTRGVADLGPMLRHIAPVLLVAAVTFAHAATRPSEESIRDLLEITDTRRVLDSMMAQMDVAMKNAMAQASKGKPASPELNAIIDRVQTKTIKMLNEELDWSILGPIYISVYQDHFSQEEVDGMLGFYKTPVGKAVIRKLPAVIEQSMLAVQNRMGPMLKKAELIQKEAMREMQELAEKKANLK